MISKSLRQHLRQLRKFLVDNFIPFFNKGADGGHQFGNIAFNQDRTNLIALNNLVHNVLIDLASDFAKDGMLVVEPRGRHMRDEKLAVRGLHLRHGLRYRARRRPGGLGLPPG